ncbi:MAG: DUF445 domain-containing protein, partial [Negativicutes bacterium]|nr:DUF445 domain-containing protein [Negativicutes bacterium]
LTSRAEQLVRRYARRLVLAPRWAALGQWALEQQKTERIFNLILDELTDILKKPGTLAAIYRYLHKVKGKHAGSLAAKVIFWLGEQTDSINLREAARALQQELITALDELRAPEHPLNLWAVGRIAEMIHNLENEPALQEAVISWAEMIVSRASLGGFVEQAVCSMTAVLREWEDGGGREIRHMPPLLRYVAAQIAGYWDSFKENAELKHWVDQFIRQALLRLIATEHHIIGGIVREALEAFGDEDLSAFIEEKAGDDLQWIRINGSVVGGIVGLLLFLFLRFVYDPMITPHIKSWL